MTHDFDPNRDAGGRFAPGFTSASNIELTLPAVPDPPDSVEVISCDDPIRLQEYVTHPDWSVRCDATANPHLTMDQARFLCDPDEQPESVRQGMAMSAYPDVSRYLRDDPSPTVRALLSAGWDVPADEVTRLRRDARALTLSKILGFHRAPQAA